MSSDIKVFVTGAAGYVGSHTVLELLRGGFQVFACDNYCNSSPQSLARVQRIANTDFQHADIDVRDGPLLTEAVLSFRPNVVVHFAGLKSVRASSVSPIDYYDNNVAGTLSLLKAMDIAGCKRLVFSSSATVYGEPEYLPYDEVHPLAPVNTYGRTKLIAENLISDWTNSKGGASSALLRYFNPIGAHFSGEIGEDPSNMPENLMPLIAQVAVGKRPYLDILGQDYDTKDGTAERDYIHVVDLALAHIAAISYTMAGNPCDTFNIGTGSPNSVLEVVKVFEEVSGVPISIKFRGRRAGDLPIYFGDAGKAKRILGWRSNYSLNDACASAWKWQSRNPDGYS